MRIIHLGQVFLSAYSAYHSYVAIANLQTYEETSKKLADWSTEAANQLSKTRSTQAAGAIAVRSPNPITFNQIILLTPPRSFSQPSPPSPSP